MTVDPTGAPTTALLTDHYELTMVDAALRSGVDSHRCVFELWGRRLPPGRRFGVVAGAARAVDAIGRFRFGDAELAFLEQRHVVSAQALDWLARFRFTGDVHGYPEGERTSRSPRCSRSRPPSPRRWCSRRCC